MIESYSNSKRGHNSKEQKYVTAEVEKSSGRIRGRIKKRLLPKKKKILLAGPSLIALNKFLLKR